MRTTLRELLDPARDGGKFRQMLGEPAASRPGGEVQRREVAVEGHVAGVREHDELLVERVRAALER